MNNRIPLFTIPLFYYSISEFEKKWKDKFKKQFTNYENSSTEHQRLCRIYYSLQEPCIHKYNNILGYAELVVDEREILVYYYLNGDRRKIYNRFNLQRQNSQRIFKAEFYDKGATFKNYSNPEIREAIFKSIRMIENRCNDWKVYANLTCEKEMIDFFDYKGYFEKMNWIGSLE